jgi:mannose-6-phosphate isomerase-like protein (cupin superfamily)
MYMNTPYREKRPWGDFVEFIRNTTCTVKIITVNPGQSLSLQFHQNRDEFWHVISGNGKVQIGEEMIDVSTGSEHFISKLTKHRIHGGTEILQLLEISYGDFDENDITRIEDNYGRV